MSSNFYTSSHCQYNLHTRSYLQSAPGRNVDLQYCTPRQLYCLHIWFAGLIQKIGKKAYMKPVPIATAQVFFKRFYIKNSICETNPYLVAAACVFVAAKVEETPLHIKSAVTEANQIYRDNGITSFPAETNKLGEMEFYLLEDLDFHLVVFHPHRALLNMMGREAADGGRWPKTRVEEDRDLRAAEEARTKKAGTANPGGGVGGVMGRGRSSSTASQPAVGASSPGAQNSDGKQEGEESEEARITRLMSRGSMQGLMEVDDSAFQMSSFIITDSYRTDVSLLYPPYIIALAAMYIALTFNGVQSANVAAMASNNAAKGLSTGLAVHHKPSNSTQTSSIPEAISTNAALGLPPPPGTKTAASGAPAPAAAAAAGGPMNNNRGGPGGSVPTLGRTSSTASLPAASSQSSASAHTAAPVPGRANPSNRPLPPGVITAAQFISTFNVSLPVLFACVQDLVALYPIWEGFEPHQPGGAIASGLAGAAPGAGTRNAGAGGGTGAGMFNGSLAFSQGQASASAQGIGVGVSVGGAAATMQMRQAQMHAVAQAQAQAQAQAYGNGQNHSQGQGGDAKQKPFTPQEADALVRRMIEEHARDMAHPDNASIAGSSSSHVGAGDEVGMGMGGMKKGQAVATAQIAGKKRRH